jgi:hypothetical protein
VKRARRYRVASANIKRIAATNSSGTATDAMQERHET